MYVVSVVHSVCGRTHIIGKTQLQVREYYRSIGVVPPDLDTSSPQVWLPQPLPIDWDVIGVQYLMGNSQHRRTLEEILARCDAKVTWPDTPDGHLCLHCTLRADMVDFEQKLLRWEDEAVGDLTNFLEGITWKAIPIQRGKLWKMFLQEAGDLEELCGGGAVATVSHADNEVNLIGAKGAVQQGKKRILSILGRLKEQLSVESRVTMETLPGLKPHQIKLLEADKFVERMSGIGEHLKVEIQDGEVRFMGLPEKISDAQTEVMTQLVNIQSEDVEFSSMLLKLAQSPEVATSIDDHLRGLPIVWESLPKIRTIRVYAFWKDHLLNGVEVLKKLLTEQVNPE